MCIKHACVHVHVCVCVCMHGCGWVCMSACECAQNHAPVCVVCVCMSVWACLHKNLSVVPNMPSQHLKTLSLNPIIPHKSIHACVWQSY